MTDQLAPDDVDATGVDDATEPIDTTKTPDLAAGDPVETDADDVTEPSPKQRQRVRRWDRPPEPRDWRFWVGNLGRVLIVTGVLMFGFVAYQLWGTGIETARAQASLENQFEELLAASAAGDGGDTGDTSSDGSTDPADPADRADGGVLGNLRTGAADADAETNDDAVNDPAGRPSTDAGVLGNIRRNTGGADVPVAVDLADEAVVQDLPPIVRGDVLARLEIPRIDQVEYIVPGVALEDLKKGSGHYPDTPLPGQLGNAAIAGHRTTYGAPFFDVDQLGSGDELVVTMANGDRFVYLVTFVEVVSANDYWVVSTTDPNTAELTLTSCHPKYTARDRIVVHSVLDPTQSSNVGIPTFYELEPDEAEPIPGDDPVVEQPDSDVVDEPDPGQTEGGDGVEADPAPSDSERTPAQDADEGEPATDDEPVEGALPITTAPPQFDADAEPADAFSQGWFEDRAAFGQIALWAAALALVTVSAYRVARRFRRYWPGFVIGVVPFLVALYFFYQNVNRLLPPGI